MFSDKLSHNSENGRSYDTLKQLIEITQQQKEKDLYGKNGSDLKP